MKGSTEAQGLTTFFNGIFDGQNHTIKNLNNKGFVPTKARLVKDEFKDKNNNPFTVDTYAYGLFALVKGATIKNVNVEIDFDQARYQDAKADSVGGAVGYAIQGVTLENIKVSGKIAAQDCASGIIGRISLESYTASIKDCTNNANITSEVVASGIARVYVPSAGHSLTLTNNTNNGNVVTLGSQGYYGGIAVYNQGITNYTFNNNINKGQSVTTTVLSGGNIRLD